MTPEEKRLLIQDLCMRLPYCVIVEYGCRHEGKDLGERKSKLTGRMIDSFFGNMTIGMSEVYSLQPYLRPMSSMTEDEKKEFIHCAEYEVEESVNGRHYEYYLKDYVGTPEKPICNCNAIDWLNKYLFDYRGLIENGLALEAPEGMYKTN